MKWTMVWILVPLLFLPAGCDDERVKVSNPRISVRAEYEQIEPQNNCEQNTCSLDYGLVYVGNSLNKAMQVRNLGDAGLEIQNMEIVFEHGQSTPFFLELTTPGTLEPGQSMEFDITYAPQDVGEHQATFVLDSNDPNFEHVEVALSGRSQVAPSPQLVVCVRVDASDPENTEMTCVPPQEIDFGPVALVPLGEPVPTPVILRNLGDEILVIHDVDTSEGTSGEYSLDLGQNELPIQLDAHQEDGTPAETEVVLVYTPVDGGTDNGFIEIESNDPDNRLVTVRLTGSGIAPRICSEPLKLDFGRVSVEHSARRSFQISNCGLLTLTVATIQFGDQSSAEFSFEALPLTPFELAPEEQMEVSVLYSPVNTGFDGGRVYMQSNDPSAETGFILLQGEGTNEPICDIRVNPLRLNFGMVDVGDTASKSTVITNTGTMECSIEDIAGPSGPGANAFVFSSQPITPMVLLPGEQKQLAVRYSPQDEGPHRATVDVVSNDFDEEVTQLELYGNDPDVPECDLEIVPTEMPFGTVAMWRTATLELHINNRGAEPCTLSAVQFDPRSDEAFTIVEAPSLPARIPAHGAAMVLFGFTPIRRGLHNAEVTLVGDDPDTPVTVVTMTGMGEELNLMVIPDSVDFGQVTVGCNSPEMTVTVYNIGSSGVAINSVYLGGGGDCDPTTQACPRPGDICNPSIGDSGVCHDPTFEIIALDHQGQSSLPFNLLSAQSFTVKLRYVPGALEFNDTTLVIESTAALGAYLEVPLLGSGTDISNQTDIFQQLDNPMVDVLWVIDNSGSMIPQQQALAQNFSTFINWAITLDTDFHIGVIATEINSPETPADYFNIYPGVLVQYPGFPKILTNTTPNLAQAFSKNVNVGTCCSDEQESGLHAAMMALSEPLISAPAANGGFLREDAKLVIIIVSDEHDQSPAPPDFYVDFFKNIKGYRNDQLMDVSVIVGDVPGGCYANGIEAEPSPRYIYVQEETDGIFRSHCSADWGNTLSDLGLDSFAARTQFPLTRPANPATIVVTVDEHDGNGPQIIPEDTAGDGSGWEYDDPTNSVVFGDLVVPGRGATITVRYETTCIL